jgi:hypothetical protein
MEETQLTLNKSQLHAVNEKHVIESKQAFSTPNSSMNCLIEKSLLKQVQFIKINRISTSLSSACSYHHEDNHMNQLAAVALQARDHQLDK